MDSNISLTIVQLIIIGILFLVMLYMVRQNMAIKREQRIGRYSIEPVRTRNVSVFDIINKRYFEWVKKISNRISGNEFIKKLAKPYSKYVLYGEDGKEVEYIVHKVIISIGFIMLTIFSQVLQTRLVTSLELIVNLIIGYYILDVYLFSRQKMRIRLIQNEMLRAVIIMNNAFKSGKSTLQAVEMASSELPDPIRGEFKKMYKDMKYGLEIDTVFARFAKRIDIDESKYIASSLVVLNRTGGNIVEVFSSIERTLFDKKKLQEELKNLTVASNMVVKVLLCVPVIFVLIIYLLNPSYFDPLFASPLGYLVLAMIFVMFIVYVWFLQRIMKVRV